MRSTITLSTDATTRGGGESFFGEATPSYFFPVRLFASFSGRSAVSDASRLTVPRSPHRFRPPPRRSCASASWRLTGGRSWWTRRWRRSGTTTCRFGWTRPSRRRRGRSRSALNPNDSARRGERIDRRRIDRSRLEPRATGPDRLARLMIQTTLHDVSLRYSSSSPAEKTRQPGSEKVFPSRLACLRYIWYRRYRGETLVSFIKVAHESRGPSFSDASGTTDGIFSTWGSARLRSARTRP